MAISWPMLTALNKDQMIEILVEAEHTLLLVQAAQLILLAQDGFKLCGKCDFDICFHSLSFVSDTPKITSRSSPASMPLGCSTHLWRPVDLIFAYQSLY